MVCESAHIYSFLETQKKLKAFFVYDEYHDTCTLRERRKKNH